MPNKAMERPIIPYGRQSISDEDINEVIKVLKSDYLTQGPKIKEFEEKFSRYIGSQYAVAVTNGTAALHLSAMALNVNKGTKVITSSLTFSASANAVRYCGGEVVFTDIDPKSKLICPDSLKKLLRKSPKGTYHGIIPVDFAGQAVDVEALRSIANEYNLWILEDACHAPGGYFVDSKNIEQKCGNGIFSDLSIFSFHPVKHIATGEGGMITTNNKDLYERLIELRTHGITRDASKFSNSTQLAYGNQSNELSTYPGWYMEMQELGYNYRLSDMNAALGISQLKRADEGLKKRKEIANKYQVAFDKRTWLIDQSGNVDGHAYHLYTIEVEKRNELYDYLRSKRIYVQVHYLPVHLMPYYRELGWKQGDFPNAETYYSRCLSLPMYPSLSNEQQDYVINNIKEFYIDKQHI